MGKRRHNKCGSTRGEQLDNRRNKLEIMKTALKAIASCECIIEGDVVWIAKEALRQIGE